MEPDVRTPGDSSLDPALFKKIRWALIALIAVGIAVFVYFLVQASSQDKALARWDRLAEIRERFEPDLSQDPLFEDPAGVYTTRRDSYAKELEAFLPEAKAQDDALAPHVTYLLARIYTDQFYASQDPSEAEARQRYYGLATKFWETLRDDYPDFPGNLLRFAPPGHGSVVRMVLANLEANRSWADEHFSKPKEPDTSTKVLFRTTAGDFKLGLYSEDAPELVQRFLERVRSGEYDGTYFFARTDEGTEADPIRRTIRGGNPDVRDVQPYDAAGAAHFGKTTEVADLLPAPSRYRIATDRGVVAAWHGEADPYDGAAQILVAVERSPALDYNFSPIGRLLDEPSRATAQRIFDRETWGDVALDEPPEDLAEIRDFLRAPVRIVKALAYRDGALLAPEGTPAPGKAAVDASEESLDTLIVDAYRTEAPAPPVPPADGDAPAPPAGDGG